MKKKPKVKPLDWVITIHGDYARTSIGTYTVQPFDNKFHWECGEYGPAAVFNSIEDAKKNAEAYHEERILSELELDQ